MIFLALAASAALAITPADVTAKPWLGQVDTNGWTLIAMTDKKNRINLYQPVSGPATGSIRLAWVRRECEASCTRLAPGLSGVILYKLDCTASTQRILLNSSYSERNLRGVVSAVPPYDDGGDSPVLPETVQGRAFAIACGHGPAE